MKVPRYAVVNFAVEFGASGGTAQEAIDNVEKSCSKYFKVLYRSANFKI